MQKPKEFSLCLVIQRGMRLTPVGLCHRVIVNEKPLNLERTTSCVLSVLLLIYDHDNQGLDKGLVDQEVVRSHIVPGNLLFTQPSSRYR